MPTKRRAAPARPQKKSASSRGRAATKRASHEANAASVIDSIRRVVRVIRLQSQEIQQGLGISAAQLLVLEHLDESPAESLRDLAHRTFTDQSAVSVVIARLVARRYVRRRPSVDDRRRSGLELTSAGRALVRGAPMAAPVSGLVVALRQLPEVRVRGLARELRALTDALGVASEPAMMLMDEPRARRGRRKG